MLLWYLRLRLRSLVNDEFLRPGGSRETNRLSLTIVSLINSRTTFQLTIVSKHAKMFLFSVIMSACSCVTFSGEV